MDNRTLSTEPRIEPNWDAMVWTCTICKSKRQDKYIRVRSHDLSTLFDMETGEWVRNIKYCSDMPGCQEKADNYEFVVNNCCGEHVREAYAKRIV